MKCFKFFAVVAFCAISVSAFAGGRRLVTVPIMVTDYDQAINFYTQSLGLKLVTDYSGYQEADCKTGRTVNLRWVIVQFPNQPDMQIVLEKPNAINNGKPILVVQTDDIDADYGEMKSTVNFRCPPIPQSWGGKQALFYDPFGNLFALIEKPKSNK